MHYDEDGDPVGRQSFEDAVIEAAAVKLLADTKESKHALKERVERIRDEELRAAIAGDVRAAMDLPIQRTSPWGEKKGAASRSSPPSRRSRSGTSCRTCDRTCSR